jgi:hypothetical protein
LWPSVPDPVAPPLDPFLSGQRGSAQAAMDRVARQDPLAIQGTWEVTCEEVGKGFLMGPYKIHPADSVNPSLPAPGTLGAHEDAAFRFIPRFGIAHNTEPGQTRPIDDGRFPGLNEAATWGGFPWLPCVDLIVATIQLMYRAFSSLRAFKFDHKSAYKSWPVHARDLVRSVIVVQNPVTGIPVAYLSPACCFGTIGSVANYCGGISMAVTVACARLLYLALVGYVDDYIAVDSEPTAESAFSAVALLHQVWGIRVKAKKTQPPTTRTTMLGLRVQLVCPSKTVRVRPSKRRRREAATLLREAVKNRRLSQKLARRLGGKIGFIASACWGRYLRAVMFSLWKYTQDGFNPAVGTGDCEAFLFLAHAVEHAPPRTLQLQMTTPWGCNRVVAWLDAAWEGGTGSVGGIVVRTGPGNTILDRFYFAAPIPEMIVLHWRSLFSKRRAQFNTQAELLAIWAFLLTFQSSVSEKSVLIFEDNRGAQFACLRGHSRSQLCAIMAARIWQQAMRLRTKMWFEFVPSNSNPGDPPSRLVHEFPQKLGCKFVPTQWPCAADIQSFVAP